MKEARAEARPVTDACTARTDAGAGAAVAGNEFPGVPSTRPGEVRTLPRRSPAEALRGALLDSRQRWRDLVTLACDVAFETDAEGRFVFIAPDQPLGWSAERLIGQPSDSLLAVRGSSGFHPFRPVEPVRGRRAWLRHVDGRLVCLAFYAAPLVDADGTVLGARGVGQDVTEQDGVDARVAASLRRGEVLEFILARVRQEVMAPRMMQAVLDALACGVGAEGAAVIGIVSDEMSPVVLHRGGRDPAEVPHGALDLLRGDAETAGLGHAPDGTALLAFPCQTRFGERAGLVLWRAAGERPWDEEDRILVRSASSIVRVVLEHESIQREMARQARTDALTALLNRRALLDEMARRLDRLDREGSPGTLMFIDLDNFKRLNDSRGHEVGDEALCIVANLLRAAVRPSDLVARLGGDEFAIWMDGCDELAAAERAELLRREGPMALGHLVEPEGSPIGMSIGIATRWPARGEGLDELIHRADQVMYEVKRNGRGHWRVSRPVGW